MTDTRLLDAVDALTKPTVGACEANHRRRRIPAHRPQSNTRHYCNSWLTLWCRPKQ